MRRGPVEQEKLWTPPRHHTPQRAPAKPHVPELELQQLRSRKTERTTELKKQNEDLAAEVEQIKETLQRNKAPSDEGG